MKTEKISKEKFNKLLFSVNRFWNGEEGLSRNRAGRTMDLSALSHIFIRDDGWSIACSNEHSWSCHSVWLGNWETIYEVESNTKKVEVPASLIGDIVNYINSIDIKVYPTREDKLKGREIKRRIENIIHNNEG